ncbi:MAG: BadF/BadG/BcrA/BcrD ATPase family protein [Eubacteriales bacterium]|nr:BadF/BadG/BcrA/BcrD ATPase family protein [Eubacteriales bacterium]
MKYYIGIDGGGTKTAAIIQSQDKTREASIVLPGSNNSYIGMEASLAIIKEAVLKLTDEVGANLLDVTSIFAGVAGASSNNYISICEDMLRKLLPNAKARVDVDALNLLAMLDNDGVVLICGTGSICFVRKGGKLERIGGNADFDQYGSGTHIGKGALMLSLQVHDGRKPDCLLNRMVEEKLGEKVFGRVSDLMKSERAFIASFAPLVFKAAEKGDTAAVEILDINMRYLAEMVNRAAELIEADEFKLVTGGGIMRDALTEPTMRKYLKCNPTFDFCSDQSRGALRMTYKQL